MVENCIQLDNSEEEYNEMMGRKRKDACCTETLAEKRQRCKEEKLDGDECGVDMEVFDENDTNISEEQVYESPVLTASLSTYGSQVTDCNGVRGYFVPCEEGNPRRWTAEEDQRLRDAVAKSGQLTWRRIAGEVRTRDHVQCLQRWQKVLRPGLVKGQWSLEEDSRLIYLVSLNFKNWGKLAVHMPGRTSKQCRERWCHHLDPNVVKSDFSKEEDEMILSLHATYGNKWAQISRCLPGRTENSVKIRFKSLERMLAKQNGQREDSISSVTSSVMTSEEGSQSISYESNNIEEENDDYVRRSSVSSVVSNISTFSNVSNGSSSSSSSEESIDYNTNNSSCSSEPLELHPAIASQMLGSKTKVMRAGGRPYFQNIDEKCLAKAQFEYETFGSRPKSSSSVSNATAPPSSSTENNNPPSGGGVNRRSRKISRSYVPPVLIGNQLPVGFSVTMPPPTVAASTTNSTSSISMPMMIHGHGSPGEGVGDRINALREFSRLAGLDAMGSNATAALGRTNLKGGNGNGISNKNNGPITILHQHQQHPLTMFNENFMLRQQNAEYERQQQQQHQQPSWLFPIATSQYGNNSTNSTAFSPFMNNNNNSTTANNIQHSQQDLFQRNCLFDTVFISQQQQQQPSQQVQHHTLHLQQQQQRQQQQQQYIHQHQQKPLFPSNYPQTSTMYSFRNNINATPFSQGIYNTTRGGTTSTHTRASIGTGVGIGAGAMNGLSLLSTMSFFANNNNKNNSSFQNDFIEPL